MQIFVFTNISDYSHLNITMKFSSTYISEDLSFGKVLKSYCFLFYFKPKWAYKLPRSNVLSVTEQIKSDYRHMRILLIDAVDNSAYIYRICVFCKYMLRIYLQNRHRLKSADQPCYLN